MLSVCRTALPLCLVLSFALPCRGTRQADSLYLRALYNFTGGDNWTDNTNWTTSEAVDTWFGITVEGGRVTAIDLDDNNLTGTFPSAGTVPDSALSRCETVALGRNSISGGIPGYIGTFHSLATLSLRDCNLTGPIPAEIGNLTNLRSLVVYSNSLDGPIPPELWTLAGLEQLYLRNNNLSDTIPSAIGNLANLTVFDARNNQFSGSIPPEIGSITTLAYFRLDNNSLSGSIPSEIGGMTNLQTLNLSGNNLTGEIPPQIGSIPNLYFLYLNGNNLTGAIPDELGSLTELGTLRVDENNLSGALPAGLVNLSGLEYFNFSDNRIDNVLLPQTGMQSLGAVTCRSNSFDFADLENLAPHCSVLTWEPQLPVGDPIDTVLSDATSLMVTRDMGGTDIVYQWLRKASPTANESPVVDNGTSIMIDGATLTTSEQGIYRCQGTSALLGGSIYSREIAVDAPSAAVLPRRKNAVSTLSTFRRADRMTVASPEKGTITLSLYGLDGRRIFSVQRSYSQAGVFLDIPLPTTSRSRPMIAEVRQTGRTRRVLQF
jgi:Leucine-rich repeat (LRR) protein